MRRSRSQSVFGSALEVFPEVSPLMGFSSPCGNDVPLVVVPVGIDHRDFDAVHQPDRINPNLTVFEAVIDPLNARPFKNPSSIREADRMPTDIDKVLVRIPRE